MIWIILITVLDPYANINYNTINVYDLSSETSFRIETTKSEDPEDPEEPEEPEEPGEPEQPLMLQFPFR